MKKLIFQMLLFSLVALPGAEVSGKSRLEKMKIPLLPPRIHTAGLRYSLAAHKLPSISADTSSRALSYSYMSETRTRKRIAKPSDSASFYMGLEIGGLGQRNPANADFMGFRFLWGGRLFAAFPVTRRIFLKPSAGFFYKDEGAGKTSVSQRLGEIGLATQYQVTAKSRLSLMIGINQYAEATWSSTTITPVIGARAANTISEKSPFLLRYRVGPGTGFHFKFSQQLALMANLEFTVSLSQPLTLYSGMTGGMVLSF